MYLCRSDCFTYFRPKFRSYKPQDEKLQESVMMEAQPAAVEEEVKDLLEAANEKVCIVKI